MRMLILLLVVILLGILSGAVGTRHPKRRDDELDPDDRDLFWYDHFDNHH